MNTERLNEDQIIGSGANTSTVRGDGTLIQSDTQTPQIISSSFSEDVVLNGVQYKIEKQIARSGEAEIYLISKDGNYAVFKLYYSQYKPKDEILTKLKGLKHADIICLYEYGYYHDRFYEISEYAQGGTLEEIMPVATLSKIKEIVAEVVEALNYCHDHGIIHRDIKPENIFFRTSDKKDIAIGDFGIASNVKEGEELVRTSMARTTVYAAPELFTNIQGKTTIEKSVDYYALGMTLLHLWFGQNPFEDVDEFGIMRLKTEGRVLFPDDIDLDVEKLIKGLITVNPRERWSYNEVVRWLNGEDVKVHYQTVQFKYDPYSFGVIDGEQIVVNNPKDLADCLQKYPDKGEGHVYRNSIAKWIERVDPGMFNVLMDIVERDYPRHRSAGLHKAIYILDPERPLRGLNNIKLKTQEEIAAHFEQNFMHYELNLKDPNAAFYVFLEARNLKEKADEYRGYFSKNNAVLALNTLIFKLQGADKLLIDNYTIYQPEELLKVDHDTVLKIIDQLANPNSKLSVWITAFSNLRPTIDQWRILQRFDTTTLRYALQQGFEWNGSVANNKQEFHTLFKNNFTSFFSNSNTSGNQKEAHYWLKNYVNTSFTQVVVDYLKSENYSDKDFCLMLIYVLSEYKELGNSIYPLAGNLIAQVKVKASAKTQLLKNVVEIYAVNMLTFWDQEAQTQVIRFLDGLNNYLSFVEKYNSSYPDFLALLTFRLDDRISRDIRKDIDRIKGNESLVKSYCADLQKSVERLKKIDTRLPYARRFKNERVLISRRLQFVAQKIKDEEQEKIRLTHEKFNEMLEAHQNAYIESTKSSFNKAYVSSIVIAIAAVVLLIVTYMNSGAAMEVIGSLLAVVLAILGVLLGSYADNGWAMLFGLIGGGALGNYLGKKIPIEGIYGVFVLVFFFFTGRAFVLNSQREDAVNAIGLDANEQIALTQSLDNIRQFFKESSAHESYQETIRIFTLSNEQFNKEFSDAKTNKESV